MRLLVLDTNVVLDLWHFNDPRCTDLSSAIERGTVRIVTSAAIDLELEDVLSRELFAASGAALTDRWRRIASRVQINAASPWRCRDTDDQKFLDLAFTVRADALITKDKALLALARSARTKGLAIITPEALDLRELAATLAR